MADRGFTTKAVPAWIRVGGSAAAVIAALALFGWSLSNWHAKGALDSGPWSAVGNSAVMPSALLWLAWWWWRRKVVRQYQDLLEVVSERERISKVRKALMLCGGAIGFTLLVQGIAGELRQWPVALLWVIPFAAYIIVVWFTRARRVPTPEAVQAQAQAEAEANRKTAELEDKWWFRYPLGLGMAMAAIYLLDARPKLWWLSAILFIGGLFQVRELSLLLLVIGGVGLLFSGIAALPTSLAIILGACVIAYAISQLGKPEAQRWGPLGRYMTTRRLKAQAREFESLPTVPVAREAIRAYWTENHDLTRDFPESLVPSKAQDWMGEAILIGQALDPRLQLRAALLDAVHEMARFQVLVIPPAPEVDVTGLRGRPGITGELRDRLLSIVRSDEVLNEWMQTVHESWGPTECWDTCLLRYRVAFAHAHVLMLLRTAFDDRTDPDWFKPLVEVACATWENIYRAQSGMPTALDPDPLKDIVLVKEYSLLFDAVLEGAQDPVQRWKELIATMRAG